MNITSYGINKFMKLLAVVGFLGLIPSVAGGLLGMNAAGNPWSVTLGQVASGIAMGMSISLYVLHVLFISHEPPFIRRSPGTSASLRSRRYRAGGMPKVRLNARLNAASDS